jgi:DNA-binding transcriptional LysR family regulator
MSDHLFALRLFGRVARKGSFSAAGRELGIPQSTVSRTIAGLEREIGASLLVRNTRAVTLTDAGAEFLARLEPILGELDDAEHAARGTEELRGLLRIGLGSSLAVREVIPKLPPFIARNPALRVDLILDEQRQDLVTEGIDVALRFGPLSDSSTIARHIRGWPRVLTASPAYLAKVGVPETPADLSAHDIIVGPVSVTTNWAFRGNGGTATSVRVEGRLRIAGNEGAIVAAIAGMGIVMTSSGAVRHELDNGRLVRILEDWDLGPLELNAVFPGGKAVKRSARAFADHLVDVLRGA